MSARLSYRAGLAIDAAHQVVQDLTKDGTVVLKAGGQGIEVNARLGKARQHPLAIASVDGERRADVAMIAKGFERGFRHGVDRERSGEGLHVENVGGLRVLGAGAGP